MGRPCVTSRVVQDRETRRDGQPRVARWVVERWRRPKIASLAASTKANPSPLNLELLAVHGYAVLVPSMPLGPAGVRGDPYLDVSKGVIAAMDRVVDLGIADPKWLAVMGQRYGGYSAYALITSW